VTARLTGFMTSLLCGLFIDGLFCTFSGRAATGFAERPNRQGRYFGDRRGARSADQARRVCKESLLV
jgi:hypothetical protein